VMLARYNCFGESGTASPTGTSSVKGSRRKLHSAWTPPYVVESGREVLQARDLLLKSIALAQIHSMSLAQFSRYALDDSSGCKMQMNDPSSSLAFFR